jgi:hypothetical protein
MTGKKYLFLLLLFSFTCVFFHLGIDCAKNRPDFDDLAQCPDCGVFIVKGDGCMWILCLCGADFHWLREVVRLRMQSLLPAHKAAFCKGKIGRLVHLSPLRESI